MSKKLDEKKRINSSKEEFILTNKYKCKIVKKSEIKGGSVTERNARYKINLSKITNVKGDFKK